MGINNSVADALKRQPAANQTALRDEITSLGKTLRRYDMKSVDDVAPPPPPQNPEANAKDLHTVDINEETKDNISRVQGNQELQQNAIDRAMIKKAEKQAKGIEITEPQIEPEDMEH